MKAIIVYYNGKEAEASTINNIGKEIKRISNNPETIVIHSLTDEEVAKGTLIMTAQETERIVEKKPKFYEEINKASLLVAENFSFEDEVSFKYDLFSRIIHNVTTKNTNELVVLRSAITLLINSWNTKDKKEFLKTLNFSDDTYSYLIKMIPLINSYL